MTFTEEISVFRYQPANDGFGGQLPATPELMVNAPTWAKIEQDSGNDITLNERWATRNNYTITVNERPGFTWARNMFIVSANYGVLDIEGIKETIRKRQWELDGVYIDGVDDTGSGAPAIIAGLTVLYYTVPADAETLSFPAIDGATVYLIFRDGNERTVVSSNPKIGEVMVDGSELSLVTGDIFMQGERITIMYL
jgi:hypothetical protein